MSVKSVRLLENGGGVGSRVSWAAILAGAAIALVSLLILSGLGAAVGLSVTRGRMPSSRITVIWELLVAFLSLFLGGWATSQGIARETRREAVFHGVVLWGMMFLILAYLGSIGILTNLNPVMGLDPIVGNRALAYSDMMSLAREIDLTPQQMARLDEILVMGSRSMAFVADAWWTLTGMLSSLAAAMLGCLTGFYFALSHRRVWSEGVSQPTESPSLSR